MGLATVDWANSGLALLGSLADVLGWTPLGAAFAVPGDAAEGQWGASILKLLIAAGTLWVIWLAWQALVAKMLVTPGREASAKSYRGLGWFDRMPQGATGALAARGITYWFRDARYWVSFIMVPIAPLLVMIPLALAGVPQFYLWLIPVPLICLFLGWSLHNDVAYDSTAIWLHVASGVRGASDRIGRLVPVLIAGILVIGLGSAVTVFILNDWRLLPSLLGISTALLLGGLGIGSITSARLPYPVVKPGDSPFQQPQSSGTITALVQSLTMFGALLIALPAGVFARARALRRPRVARGIVRAPASDSACSSSRSGSGAAARVFDRPRPRDARGGPARVIPRRIERMIPSVRMSIADPDSPGGGTSVLDRELEKLLEEEAIEPGDHERFSHYVKKEKILESALTGKPVQGALRQEVDAGARPREVPGLPDLQRDLRAHEGRVTAVVPPSHARRLSLPASRRRSRP